MSEEKVILEEAPAEAEETQEVDTTGLDAKEIEAAKEHGIVKKDSDKGSKEEKKDDKAKEGEAQKGEEKVKADEKKPDEADKPLDPADFDDMDAAYGKDEAKFHKNFTSNAKALYFKFKRNKQMRQDAEELATTTKKELEFFTAKEKSYIKQLAEVEGILDKIDAGDENLTTADIRKVLAFKKELAEKKEEKEEKAESKPDAKAEEKEKAYLTEKAKNAQLLGKSKYENFDQIVGLANEVVAQDKDIALLITKAYHDPEVDEDQLVEKIVKYAKLNPKFGEKPKEETPKGEKKDIDRILANAGKKKSSASVTSGSGRREVSYDELTVEDVGTMSQTQWNKLPQSTRERLMKESS